MRRTVHPTTTSQEIPPAALPRKKWNPFLKLGLPQVAQIKMWFLKMYKENENIRSKRFRLVSEQKKTEERDFLFWPREKWNDSQKMKEGGGGGEGRKRLQTNPSILKTCVRQRTQRLIGSASRAILTWQAKWAVFKIEGFVCKHFLPFFPTPSPLFYLRHFSRGLWLSSFFAPKPHRNACYAG